MADNESTLGGYIRGLVTGALIGAGIALLLAPKRGEELREELIQGASDLKDKGSATLADRAQDIKDRATELGQNVAQTAQDLTQRGQESIDNAQENAKNVAKDVADKVSKEADKAAKKASA